MPEIAMIGNDVQRGSKLSIGPANRWSRTKIDAKGKMIKMEMVADVETDTVGKTGKEAEAESVYIDADLLSDRRGEKCWKGGRGRAVVEGTTGHADGQRPRPIAAHSSRPQLLHFPSITAYRVLSPHWRAARPIDGDHLRMTAASKCPELARPHNRPLKLVVTAAP
jgi:hypothetical protein